MGNYDVLHRSFSPREGLFLEASAGTGKTFTIEHLVVRLLIEADLDLRQILVVTFTKAATRELKLRIWSNLEKAEAFLRKRESPWDYLTALIEKGEEALFAAQRKLELALGCFDEAQIFTVHGFCHKLIADYGFLAQAQIGIEEKETTDQLPAVREAIYDFFRTQFTFPSYGMSQISRVLRKHQNDLSLVAQQLEKLILSGKSFEKQKSFDQELQELRETAKEFPLSPQKLGEDYDRLEPCYKGMKRGFREQAEQFFLLLSEGGTDEQWDLFLEEKEFFLEKMIPENQKIRKELPSEALLHYPSFFAQMRKLFLPKIDSLCNVSKIMLRMASAAKELWEQRAASSEFLTPDDFLKKVDSALAQPLFLQAVKRSYVAGIVDEFQDTDPIQWKVIQKLFLEDPEKRLFLIGDPKQSIYSFRRADVYTYLSASAAFGESNRAALTTNFRSDPALLAALNALFSYKNGWIALPALQSALAYEDLQPAPNASNWNYQDGKGAIHFVCAQGKSRKGARWPSSDLEQEALFPYLVTEIKRLHANAQLPYREMAVLIKDRYQAVRLQDYLQKEGLSVSLSQSSLLRDSPALHFFSYLLDALVFLDDENYLKRLIAGPVFSFTAQQLQDRLWIARAKERLRYCAEVGREKGFGSLYQELLSTHWEEGKLSLFTEMLLGEERELVHDLRKLAELLIEQQRKESLSLEELRLFLLRFKEGEEEELRGGAADEDQLQVMTAFASKGLEFSVVFALATASRNTLQQEYISIREGDEEKMILFNPQESASQSRMQELDAEKARQLYVAFTRAKRRLYIPVLFDESDSCSDASAFELFFSHQIDAPPPLKKELFFAQFAQLQGKGSFTWEEADNAAVTKEAAAEEAPLVLTAPTPLPHSLREPILSFSSLAGGAHLPEEEESLPAVDGTVLPLGADTGTYLHHIFEKIFHLGLQAIEEKERREELVLQMMSKTPLEPWLQEVSALVEEVLSLPLFSDSSFSLSALKHDEVMQEMEFLFPHQQALYKGFIDLVFEHKGRYYLLDWKSNWLGSQESDYTMESLQKAMQKQSYFLQASIYAAALERYVKLFDKRAFSESFGGALYLFLRGKKVYHFIPESFSEMVIT